MDLSDLQTFLAVADQGSFSEAAMRVHLTQPAVSKRIAALEAELGARLFDRVGRRVLLTEAGRALRPRARKILEDLEDSRRLIRELRGEVGGHLSLGTSHHIGLHRLPAILKAFTQDYPQVRLELDFLDSDIAIEGVDHGNLELALVTLPNQLPRTLQSIAIWDDPMRLVVAADHPLARQSAMDLPTLMQVPLILPHSGTFTRSLIESRLEALGHTPDIAYTTNYLETIKMMVSVGLGWSILPSSMLDSDLHSFDCPELRFSRRLGLVYNRRRTLTNAARAFLAQLPGSPRVGASTQGK